MAEMSPLPPSPEDLRRELDALRAAQPVQVAAAEPPAAPRSVGRLLLKIALWIVFSWALLVVAFVAIWFFVTPSR